MIKKKVCMVGAFATGKSSLVRQFAHGVFSERYHTTVGVRVEKKSLELDGTPVEFILWDLHGEDDFQTVRLSYLKGAAGCFYVVDGTRAETTDVALGLKARVDEAYPGMPCVMLLNKKDLIDSWELRPDDEHRLAATGAPVLATSAKTGAQVDDAFLTLARLVVAL
jgi:small GTP-binding protein